jgi:hypothetical protein
MSRREESVHGAVPVEEGAAPSPRGDVVEVNLFIHLHDLFI